MKKIFLLIIAVILFQPIYSQEKGHIDWENDLDYLFEELSEKHYNLFTERSKDDFFEGINIVKQQTNKLSDFQIALKVQQLIASFGDSHTSLNYSQMLNPEKILPLHIFWAGDGLYILHTNSENREILEHRLLSINKTPIANVIDSISTLCSIDNQALLKSIVPQLLPSLQILEHFGFSNTEQVELDLMTSTGETKTYILRPGKMNRNNRVSFKPDSFAFSVINENRFFTDAYYPEEKIYHILYNKCWSKESELEYGNKEKAEAMPSINEFWEAALSRLDSSPIDKIIFDMRYNGGGNSAQATEFIKKLASFLDNNPEIKSYVVIGRATFSSAILNAMDFKRLTNALFIGEETAGKPNHFGEVKNFRLPSSNIYVNYSTKYFKNTDEEVNTFSPDITIEMNFSDLKQGIDPIYQWVKEQ